MGAVELVHWDGGSGAVFVSFGVFGVFAAMLGGDDWVTWGSVLREVFRLVDLEEDMVG